MSEFEVELGRTYRVRRDADGKLLEVPTVVLGGEVAPGLTVWDTWERWLDDGVAFGFITRDVAEVVHRLREDGRERVIVEVGLKVMEPPTQQVQYGDAGGVG